MPHATATTIPPRELVETFLVETDEEHARLSRELRALDEEGRRNLGGVLGRFDQKGRGILDPRERLLARRVLGRLRRPSTPTLALLNRVLDYLDLNANAILEDGEVELCVEILEVFSRADTDDGRLSDRELRMLYAVLRHLDANHNGRLDADERKRLRECLRHPADFLDEQRRTNPRLKELLPVC